MSNAKIRARRVRRARLGWTRALTPIELSLSVEAPASFKLQEYVDHVCQVAVFVPPELKKTVREVLLQWHEKGALV